MSLLPDYNKCIEIISNDSVLSNHIDRFVGTSVMGGCHISASELLEKFVKSGELSKRCMFNNEAFDKAYIQFENEIYSDFILCEAIAPLQGLFANNIEVINLADNLEISQLSQREENLLHTTNLLRRYGFRWSDNLYAVRAKYLLPKLKTNDISEISDFQRMEGEKLQLKIENLVKRVIHTMKVFKQGTIHYGGILHWRKNDYFSVMNISPKTLELVDGVYILKNNEEINALKEFYRKIEKLIFNSQNNAIEKAIRIYGSCEINWGDLYKVYEIIESDIGGFNRIVNKGWNTKAEINLFKHTANSPSAVGDDSRHGKENTSPPINPPSLSEAGFLIEDMLKHWIDSK